MLPVSALRWCRTGPALDHRETVTPTGTKLVIQPSEKKKKQNLVFYQTREAKYSFLIDSKLNTAELTQAFSSVFGLHSQVCCKEELNA